MQTPRNFATELLLNFLDTCVKLPAIHLLNKYLYMSKRHNVPEEVITLEIGKLLIYMQHMHPERGYINDGTDINAFDQRHSFMIIPILWMGKLVY